MKESQKGEFKLEFVDFLINNVTLKSNMDKNQLKKLITSIKTAAKNVWSKTKKTRNSKLSTNEYANK